MINMTSAAFRAGVSTSAVLSVFFLLAAGAFIASAEVDNDQGTVSYYTYTVNFAFEGTDAESIEWDFGFDNPDGTRATSTEWNPQGIVFPAKGIYTVTQTVSNPVGSYTSQLKVNILGTPEITFVSNGGSDVPMQTVRLGQKVAVPENPTKEGHTFAGWFTDSACTERYDFDTAVAGHMSLYAKWTDGSSSVPSDDGDSSKDKSDDLKEKLTDAFSDWRVIVLVFGAIVCVALIRRK